MEVITKWIVIFLRTHFARYPRYDWPVEGSEAWDEQVRMWTTAFATRRISQYDADLASLSLAANPPRFADGHIPAIVHAVAALQGGNSASTDDRTEAARQSRNCEYCGGNGMTTAYHPRYDGSRTVEATNRETGEVCRARSTVAAHCVCPMGRWMRSQSEDDDRKRIADGLKCVNGQSDWSLDDPTMREVERSSYRAAS